MSEPPKLATKEPENMPFEDENSNDGLQIVESPRQKSSGLFLDENEKQIIADLEKNFEQNLEEKAAKSNLTAINVKSILKQVVTNEHVLAMLRQAENPESDEKIVLFEPKFTRAKTKELLSKRPATPIPPWASPKSPSEVQVLLSGDLQEESDDEYLPDQTSSQLETSFEDIPETPHSFTTEEMNVALRTRSKLDLNDTPLEEIERAFMPPDITTDMYDVDCDDDVWQDFLKTFTKPLDELAKATEDEDQDPEYNILADDDIDEVDTEELRADRAVTVSKKEFNVLIAELFEFAENYETNEKEINKILADTLNNSSNTTNQGKIVITGSLLIDDEENDASITIKKRQIPLLAQQLRQHVQILTQNFLLTYQHPEYFNYAEIYKQNLLKLKRGQENKKASIFYIINLDTALKLVEDWEKLFQTNSKQVIETKVYVDKVLVESVQARIAGLEYISTFPPLILETISRSDIFLYPNLLPRVPFKSYNIPKSKYHFFTQSEDNLISLYLERLLPDLRDNPTKKRASVSLQDISIFIHDNLLYYINPNKIFRHIQGCRRSLCDENPITFFFKHKRSPTTVHYVVPLDVFKVLPPCKRSAASLPLQWRNYIFPEQPNLQLSSNYGPVIIKPLYSPISKINKLYNLNVLRGNIKYRRILPKGPVPCSPFRKRKRKAKRNLFSTQFKMLPDMPILGTPLQENSEKLIGENIQGNGNDKETENVEIERSLASEQNETTEDCNSISTITEPEINNEQAIAGGPDRVEPNTEKDNLDDINELMIASSTVQMKSEIRKKPGGAEKKRAKLRREFLANLSMATPESVEVERNKEDSFADSFMEKLRDTLETEDYSKLIDVMAQFDEQNEQFVNFYNVVKSILTPKYKELADEFLLFLTELQANQVGELMPYFLMKDMDRFIKKVQVFFKDQPSQIKKIVKCLSELTESQDLTMDNLKTTFLPLFKNNVALTEWFLQIFPLERPPTYLINNGNSYEVVDLKTELARQPDKEIYETISVPDTEDTYGGATCICTCHNVENVQFQSRFQHCNKCGLKFLQGKVYIQTGKQLRPAVVSFLTNPEKDHMKRLRATERKRSENSPNKKESPSKEQTEDNRNSYESGEEDCDGNKKKKTKRIRKITKDPEKIKEKSNKKIKPTAKKQATKKAKITKKVEQNEIVKPGSSVGQQKRLATDEHLSDSADILESETDFLESSQDVTNTTDSDEEAKKVDSQKNTWTREEDKIILQTFKQRDNEEETFVHISQLLSNRTVTEIRNRFRKLMELLQEMASNSGS